MGQGTREQRNQMEWKGKEMGVAERSKAGLAGQKAQDWAEAEESWTVNRDKAWPWEEINLRDYKCSADRKRD